MQVRTTSDTRSMWHDHVPRGGASKEFGFLTQVSLLKKPTESMTSPCDAWLPERMFCTPTKNFLVARPCRLSREETPM